MREGFFERGPVFGLRHLKARELIVALELRPLTETGKLSPGHAVGVVLECGARQDAFGLVADVEKDGVGGDGDDGAFQLAGVALGLVGMAALELREQIAEGFGGGFRCGWTGEDGFGMISFDIIGYRPFSAQRPPFDEVSQTH